MVRWHRLMALVAMSATLVATPVDARTRSANCYAWDGAAIYSGKKFLGTLSSKYDSKSAFNKYGTYGSPYSSDSIWNKYGSFGSPYSAESAFNPYTSSAPIIVKNGKVIGRLSTNKYLAGAVSPLTLAINCYEYQPD